MRAEHWLFFARYSDEDKDDGFERYQLDADFKKCIGTRPCAFHVIPVKTGIQSLSHIWTPSACAGVTTPLFALKRGVSTIPEGDNNHE